jgi:hypothetical protein
MTDLSVPRGVRNNNPGNIRKGTAPWLGLAPDQPDPNFCSFISPEYGIRAIAKIMQTYKSRGVATIREAISRWAPTTENDTAAYVAAVCANCSVGADERVDLDEVMPELVKAIIQHENGEQPYPDDIINAGVALS